MSLSKEKVSPVGSVLSGYNLYENSSVCEKGVESPLFLDEDLPCKTVFIPGEYTNKSVLVPVFSLDSCVGDPVMFLYGEEGMLDGDIIPIPSQAP